MNWNPRPVSILTTALLVQERAGVTRALPFVSVKPQTKATPGVVPAKMNFRRVVGPPSQILGEKSLHGASVPRNLRAGKHGEERGPGGVGAGGVGGVPGLGASLGSWYRIELWGTWAHSGRLRLCTQEMTRMTEQQAGFVRNAESDS